MNELGYFLYMEEQEKKAAEEIQKIDESIDKEIYSKIIDQSGRSVGHNKQN